MEINKTEMANVKMSSGTAEQCVPLQFVVIVEEETEDQRVVLIVKSRKRIRT